VPSKPGSEAQETVDRIRLDRLAIVAATCAVACAAGPASSRSDAVAMPAAEIISCVDLPRDDARSHNLSGLAWDPIERRLYAVSDRDPWIVVLVPRPGFTGFELGATIRLDLPVDPWDGEALALDGDHFLVIANETLPALFRVDRAGHGGSRIALPDLPGIRDNLGLEGIGYIASAGGRFVFAVNEEALIGDGPLATPEHGTVVRILRHSLDGRPDLEVAYLTEPIFTGGRGGDNGVSDLAALSPDRVLVLERAYVPTRGNAVRIYDVDLRGARNIAGLPDARAVTAVAKRLVVDVGELPDGRCSTPPMPQHRKTLDNYEGMALGPTLPDGRRLVFLASDDNDHATQVPRLLTLAIAPGAL
jgi:hypothetical protein